MFQRQCFAADNDGARNGYDLLIVRGRLIFTFLIIGVGVDMRLSHWVRIAFNLVCFAFLVSVLFVQQAPQALGQVQVAATEKTSNRPVLLQPPALVFRDSTVSFKLKVPTSTIVEAANAVSDVYRELGAVEPCPGDLSCNYSYDVTFTRVGSVKISTDQKILKVSVIVDVTGDVSFRPTGNWEFIKDIVGGDEKWHSPLSGRFEATLKMKPSIEPEWCLDPGVILSTKWLKRPKLESAVMNFGVSQLSPIATKIEESIQSFFSDEKIASTKSALCDVLRERLSSIWRTHSIPIKLKHGKVFVTIQPSYVRYSGPSITAAGLELGIGLGARTLITPTDRTHPPSTLPSLQQSKSITGDVYLEVPAVVSLREIKAAAVELIATENFEFSLPFGGLLVQPQLVEPSIVGDRLQFLVDFGLSAWWLPIELTGKALIHAEPRVDRAQNLVVFDRIDADVSLNSRVLGWLFSGFVRRANDTLRIRLAQVAKYDVTPELDFSRSEIERQISQLDSVSGIRFRLSGLTPALDRVAIGVEGVSIFANAVGKLDAEFLQLAPVVHGWLKDIGNSPFRKDYRIHESYDVNMRLRPSVKSDPLDTIPRGKTVKVHDCQLGEDSKRYKWCQVSYGAKRGWVHQFYLVPG